jgi:hypothetical protein
VTEDYRATSGAAGGLSAVGCCKVGGTVHPAPCPHHAVPSTVILYSTSFHRWEVWRGGRPVAHGTLDACLQAYPRTPEPSADQRRLARNDR